MMLVSNKSRWPEFANLRSSIAELLTNIQSVDIPTKPDMSRGLRG